MNKSFLIRFLLSVLCLLCILTTVSCGNKEPSTTKNVTDATATSLTGPTEGEVWAFLAKALTEKTEYQFTQEIKKNGLLLNNNFQVIVRGDMTTVLYSVERLNGIFVSGDEIKLPDEEKTTYTGTVILKDGDVLSGDVEVLNVNIAQFGIPKWDFDEKNLEITERKTGEIAAKIKEPSKFFGADIGTISDLTVRIVYGLDLTEAVFTYSDENGATITSTFAFN